MLSVDFRETPIKAVAEDLDGYTVYCGNGSGDLASIDIRTGILDLIAEMKKHVAYLFLLEVVITK